LNSIKRCCSNSFVSITYCQQNFKMLNTSSAGSKEVEHSPHYLKVSGSNPFTARDRMTKSIYKISTRITRGLCYKTLQICKWTLLFEILSFISIASHFLWLRQTHYLKVYLLVLFQGAIFIKLAHIREYKLFVYLVNLQA